MIKNKITLKYTAMLIAALIASIGNYPYAKDFAYFIIQNDVARLFAAAFFIFSAMSANVVLGFYSLYDSSETLKRISTATYLIIGSIALISACSIGFICFFGYNKILPLHVNIILSVVVALVNAGISFSAIYNLMQSLKKRFFSPAKINKKSSGKIVLRLTVIIIALMVSFCAYLASTNGLSRLLIYWQLNDEQATHIAYLISIIVWLPYAALFAHGSQVVVAELYDKCYPIQIKLTWQTLLILLIAVPSGCAYAQMVVQFFDAANYIPYLFQVISSHKQFIIYFLFPSGFIISSLVNTYALNNLMKIMTSRS